MFKEHVQPWEGVGIFISMIVVIFASIVFSFIYKTVENQTKDCCMSDDFLCRFIVERQQQHYHFMVGLFVVGLSTLSFVFVLQTRIPDLLNFSNPTASVQLFFSLISLISLLSFSIIGIIEYSVYFGNCMKSFGNSVKVLGYFIFILASILFFGITIKILPTESGIFANFFFPEKNQILKPFRLSSETDEEEEEIVL